MRTPTHVTPVEAIAISETFSRIRTQSDAEVARQLEEFLQATGALESPLAAIASDSLQGGKRFRAICAVVGASAAIPSDGSGPQLANQAWNTPGLAQLCGALELYQACALVHDDIIDNSPVRRGLPSAHVSLTDRHAALKLAGQGEEYGRSGAILLGDLLLANADWALAKVAKAQPKTASSVINTYALMSGEVAQGQFADLSLGFEPSLDGLSVSSAMAVARVKSALYSVVRPAQLGALLLGATPATVESLRKILEPAGLAFQLRDDHLGVFGDPAQTGKPSLIDIAERKRTVLLALAWGGADEDGREILTTAYCGEEGEVPLETASDVIERFGKDAHEKLIEELVHQATQALEDTDFHAGAKALLAHLVEVLTARDA